MTTCKKPSLSIPIACLLGAGSLWAQPVVTNMTTSIYATPPEPVSLSFSPDGTLFCGRNSGDGVSAYKIYRVPANGGPAAEFGNSPILDPDAVIVDAAGMVSGTPGSVLVGGVYSNPNQQGAISKIAPDGSVTPLIGPTTAVYNPTGFLFDRPDRLLIADFNGNRVVQTGGGAPTLFLSLASVRHLALDALGRIVTSADSESRLRLYTADGALSNANFAAVKPGSPIARGPGGPWGTDLYAVTTAGDLVRIAPDGFASPAGRGFAVINHLAFGPDLALYASEHDADRVYRFAPPAVPGCDTTLYARVTDPVMLTIAPDGTLFTGRDNAGSGGNNSDAVKIHRVGPGGSPVSEYGNSAVVDPDAVFYDAQGAVSGTAGSVIVGGVAGASQGRLSAIAPNGNVSTLFGPSGTMINPSDFAKDSTGRVLFTDFDGNKLWFMTNSTPQVLLSGLSSPLTVAADALDRLVVNFSGESRLRLYSQTGTSITNSLVPAAPRTPLALGPGPFWGAGVFYLSTNGNLMSVNTAGVATRLGTGFGGLTDFDFGPDGALYATHFENDCVWRIAPGNPRLSIARNDPLPGVTVYWPSPSPGWIPQQNTNGLGTPNWSNVTDHILDDGSVKRLAVDPAVGARFYRLFKP